MRKVTPGLRSSPMGDASHGSGVRRASNRKLRQRRPWRARLSSVDLAPYLARTGASVRRLVPFLGIGVLVAGVVVGGVFGWRWLSHSPRFALEKIEVSGGTHVTAADVLAHANLAYGRDNLFALSTGAVARAVEGAPWVARAQVERSFPRTLRVIVTERQAVGLLVTDAPYLLDETGHPFKRAALEAGEATGLPVVTGLPREVWRKDPEAAAAAARLGLTLATRWNQDGARPRVGEVNLDTTGVTLYTAEHAVALRLGRIDPAALDERLARFDATWRALSDDERATAQVVYLDSSRTDRVTVKLAAAAR